MDKKSQKAYLAWLRHSEHFSFEQVFPPEFFPGPGPPVLYRGLKEPEHLFGEILTNHGCPTKGAVWVTVDRAYAHNFGPAFLMEIDPFVLGRYHPSSFLKDKEYNYTTGKAINLYSCLLPECRARVLNLAREKNFGPNQLRRIRKVLDLPGYSEEFHRF